MAAARTWAAAAISRIDVAWYPRAANSSVAAASIAACVSRRGGTSASGKAQQLLRLGGRRDVASQRARQLDGLLDEGRVGRRVHAAADVGDVLEPRADARRPAQQGE